MDCGGLAAYGMLRVVRSIMPHGYELAAKRKRLENELRQARAAELAVADKKQRARIEKEIRAEVNKRLGMVILSRSVHWPVLW
jgi:hypothetical protein